MGGKKSKLSFKFEESTCSKLTFTFGLETVTSDKVVSVVLIENKKCPVVFIIIGSEGIISFGSIISLPTFLKFINVLVSVGFHCYHIIFLGLYIY